MKTRRLASVARLTAVVPVALMLATARAEAQEPNPFSPLAVFQMADRQDWVVRASMTSGATVVGLVRDVDYSSARLEGGLVRFGDIARLERGERHAGGMARGAVIGAAVLGGLAALVLYVAPSGDTDRDEGDVILGISASAGIGAIVGGLIGAWVSPPGMHWVPIWPGHSVDR